MKIVWMALALALVSMPATAQIVPSPTPSTTRLMWDHDGINTDGYALTVDGNRSVVVAACGSEGGARLCSIPFPALTPGEHTLIVSAFNLAGEAKSDPFVVKVIVEPTKPSNIRIVR